MAEKVAEKSAENLVIVESPSKAKTIGRFLGKKYKVVASSGHLRDLPVSSLAIDIDNNFAPKYMNIRGKADIINGLKADAKKSKHVFLATDPDREGEAISWHLSYLLGIDPEKASRVTFNEITESAVKEGIKTPRSVDMDLVDAYQARRVLDRLVGYKISPILWKKVKPKLSAGRVQSAALKIICDREDEIEKFDSKEYWTISVSLEKQDSGKKGAFTANFSGTASKKITLNSEDDTKPVMEALAAKPVTVSSVKSTVKHQMPMPPFTTSTLQQEASKKLGFRTGKTMKIAQKLYEGVALGKLGETGLVTYIRTDSTRISDVAYLAAKQYINDNFGAEYVPAKQHAFKNRNTAQDAHEAIRPAHIDIKPDDVKQFLEPDEYKLYKLIFNRFIASQMEDAVYDVTSANIVCGDYVFKAAGKTVKFKGFSALYDVTDQDDEDENNKNLPPLAENEVLTLKKANPEQHFTQPPPRLTEAALVKTMEENGIGRPSTYAAIIMTIQNHAYVGIEKKALFPTTLGRAVNEYMKGSFPDIVDAQFTAGVEKELDEIAQGDSVWTDVIRTFYDGFKNSLEKAEKETEKIKIEPRLSNEYCEKCGKVLVYRTGKYGDFLACSGFPECRFTKTIVEDTGKLCPECGGKLIWRRGKTGRKYAACVNYPTCKFTSLNLPTGEKCPVCGSYLERLFAKNGRSFIKCSNKACGYIQRKGDGNADS